MTKAAAEAKSVGGPGRTRSQPRYDDPSPPTGNGRATTPTSEALGDISLEAERRVLATLILHYDDTAPALIDTIDPAVFSAVHRTVVEEIQQLHRAGRHVDPGTVVDAMAKHGTAAAQLAVDVGTEPIGARGRIVDDLATVKHHAARRAFLEWHYEARHAADDGRVEDALTFAASSVSEFQRLTAGAVPSRRMRPGGEAIFDEALDADAVWGSGGEILWSSGEPFLVVGPPGVGKTTLVQQVALARIGLLHEVLGHEVRATGSRLLYLACDRPAQIKRSLRRMVTDDDRQALDERLTLWEGPPPVDLATDPGLLVSMATEAGADTIVIDSLKDLAGKLTDDEVGAKVNSALQATVTAGIEVLVLHHQRKGTNGTKPNRLEDVYGSTWITAGAGSVVLLWGAAGEPLVELLHLKQPAEPVGPLTLEHDHAAGTTTVYRGFDLRRYLQLQSKGVTVHQVAAAMTEKVDVSDADRKKAERKLKAGISAGWIHRQDPKVGGEGGTTAARYSLIDTRREEP